MAKPVALETCFGVLEVFGFTAEVFGVASDRDFDDGFIG